MTENPPREPTPTPVPPPNDHEAERVLLGGIMLYPAIRDDLFSLVKPTAIYSPAHRAIYESMLALSSRGDPIDAATVFQAMNESGRDRQCGGAVYVAELMDVVNSPDSVLHQARRVRTMAKRRYIIDQGRKLQAIGSDPSTSPEEAETMAVQFVQAMGNTVSDVRDQSMPDVVAEHLSGLVRRSEGGEGEFSTPTPYYALNHYITGRFPGEVIVLAGRPGTGKTALALNMVQHDLDNGVPTGIVSLEMTKRLLLDRLFAAGASVDAQRFRRGNFDQDDWVRIQNYAGKLSTAPLRVADAPCMTPMELRSTLRTWKRTMGLRNAVVDYLQLLSPQDRRKDREQQVAEASRIIKTVAVELEINVLLMAQLNREAEKTKKPLMSQLRESGAIEQDADIILFIVPWKSEADVVPVEMDVAKGRNNACGSFRLMYRRAHLQFVNERSGEAYYG